LGDELDVGVRIGPLELLHRAADGDFLGHVEHREAVVGQGRASGQRQRHRAGASDLERHTSISRPLSALGAYWQHYGHSSSAEIDAVRVTGAPMLLVSRSE